MQDLDAPDSAPSFRLRFEKRPGYLYAHVSGPEDSPAISLAYWKAVAAECRKRRAPAVLLRDNLEGAAATPEEIAQQMPHLRGLGLEGLRIAFVEDTSAYLPLMEVGESIAREHGFTVRVFGREDEAVRWLRYGSPDDA